MPTPAPEDYCVFSPEPHRSSVLSSGFVIEASLKHPHQGEALQRASPYIASTHLTPPTAHISTCPQPAAFRARQRDLRGSGCWRPRRQGDRGFLVRLGSCLSLFRPRPE